MKKLPTAKTALSQLGPAPKKATKMSQAIGKGDITSRQIKSQSPKTRAQRSKTIVDDYGDATIR